MKRRKISVKDTDVSVKRVGIQVVGRKPATSIFERKTSVVEDAVSIRFKLNHPLLQVQTNVCLLNPRP